ncbi:hypothetical protein EVAR_92826_1 [Eumeta japonica]|uniref:Uncharacterized protein n=1 Tax=Eumeta variegata TaxID=151549 RepID=A0A4C1TAY6_EUMVA|nr:hypothetical protein EVAR_92826_1 [Eumeta japonica]
MRGRGWGRTERGKRRNREQHQRRNRESRNRHRGLNGDIEMSASILCPHGRSRGRKPVNGHGTTSFKVLARVLQRGRGDPPDSEQRREEPGAAGTSPSGSGSVSRRSGTPKCVGIVNDYIFYLRLQLTTDNISLKWFLEKRPCDRAVG